MKSVRVSRSSTKASSSGLAQVVLKPRKARPFFARHPWVLDSAISDIVGDPVDGDEVELVSDRGEPIARGLYNHHSRIRVRLYSWQLDQPLDGDFWRAKIEQALALRASLPANTPGGAVRLVSSDGDGLGGLVVERYADQLVIQLTSLALSQRLDQLVAPLVERVQPRGVSIRTVREMNKAEGLQLPDGPYAGEVESPVMFEEHGLRYAVDVAGGQKTGFYLDQRDNRLVAAGYFADRRVLDVCCYTGAFSLVASRWGRASEVLAIDSSATAIELAKAQADRNEITNVQFETADAFERLDALVAAGERFGAVILDPPSFARHHQAVPDALRAYHHLNRSAVSLLEPGGILVTCSCSGQVTREAFTFMLAEVAERSGRDIQVLDSRGASADHPVSLTCLETDYLKCLICRVI